MEVQVNLLGVLAGATIALLVGMGWYSKKALGARWSKLVKLNEKKARKELPKTIIALVMMTGVVAYVLAHITYLSYTYFGYNYLSSAVTTAFWVWLGFIAPVTVAFGIFEQRDEKLTLINLGQSLIGFLAMGLAIGLVGL